MGLCNEDRTVVGYKCVKELISCQFKCEATMTDFDVDIERDFPPIPPPPPTTKDCNNVYYTCCGTTSTSPLGKCDEDETLNKTCINEYFICKFTPSLSRDDEATKATTDFDIDIDGAVVDKA